MLIATFILSFVSLAILKTLDVSLLSSNLSNSLVSDADLKTAIHHVLKPDQCERNLHPDKLTDVNTNSKTVSLLKKYKDPSDSSNQAGAELIKSGEAFRDYLDIVKIELAGPETETQREFKVFYKRRKVKHLSTRENNLCDSTDQSGCYVNTCNLEYETQTAAGVTSVTTCTVLDCFSIGTGNNQSIDCYTVDKDEETLSIDNVNAKKKSRTLVGCGGTSDIEKSGMVAFGYGAGKSNTTGYRNTFLGYRAGYANTTGYRNTFLGYRAGYSNTTGTTNTFLGTKAGYSNTTGVYNIFIGDNTGRDNTTGYNNTFLAASAGVNNTVGSNNTFIGTSAGQRNTTGGQNTFLAASAGAYNTTGNSNIFLGNEAGYYNTTGSNNIFIGDNTGMFNTLGNKNTFTGNSAGYANTLGNSNTFTGYRAGYANTTGSQSTFLGYRAGYSNTTGTTNTFLGTKAGYSNTTGGQNTFLGYQAGNGNTTGVGNTFLGTKTGLFNTTGSSNIFIGDSAGSTSDYKDKHNKLVVGGSSSKTWIEGDIGTDTFKINNKQVEFQPTSSRTLKKNIRVFDDYELSLKRILETPLYTYEYKDDLPEKKRMGFVSEDLPESLQILEKGKVSRPDMPSIYGTLWASIKALYLKIKDFQKGILEKFKVVSQSLKELTPVVKNNEQAITKIQTEIKALKEENKKIKEENKVLKQKINKILND